MELFGSKESTKMAVLDGWAMAVWVAATAV
jgi:hypothetical protein